LLTICLPGPPNLPEEKIAYEIETLTDVCSHLSLTPRRTFPPLQNGDKLFEQFLHKPWDTLKKFCFKGSVHDLSFKSPLKRVPEFESIIHKLCHKYNYPLEDLGGYLLPIERGRAVHLEFDFHCDPLNPVEVDKVKQLWLQCSDVLIKNGAFFDRPYGAWADMIYTKTGTYTKKLKELKNELDPHHVMNPGKLCF
jgi:hypothetical protein